MESCSSRKHIRPYLGPENEEYVKDMAIRTGTPFGKLFGDSKTRYGLHGERIDSKPVGYVRRVFKCKRVEMTTWKPGWFEHLKVSIGEWFLGQRLCNDVNCPSCSKAKNAK